jgi:putative sporulation protein YtaF
MHWWSIVAIGIASNLDNLGIGVSYGTRSTKIPLISNFMIALLSMLCAYLSMAFGQYAAHFLPPNLANTIGGSLIIVIGIWGMRSDLMTKDSNSILANPSKVDVDGNNIISVRESLTLGTALAVNCIASGFGGGVSGLTPWAAALSIGIFSMITVGLGVKIGAHIARTWFGKYSNTIGGILLIGIGVYEILV